MGTQNYIVTIQRQFGSLGRPIAKKLSEILNIEYYDRDLLEMASKEMKVTREELSQYEEKSFSKMKYPLGLGNTQMQDYLFSVQQCVISEIGTHDKSCIIVGRCSDYILRHLKNTINIFIYAPYEKRMQNCIDVLKMNEADAKDMILKVDKARNNYHQYYTGMAADAIYGRQIMIDSSFLGVDGTAELLAEIVKRKAAAGFDN